MHCSGLQRDSLGDPLFATRVQWHLRAGDSDETAPIDLLCSIAFAGLQYFLDFQFVNLVSPTKATHAITFTVAIDKRRL